MMLDARRSFLNPKISSAHQGLGPVNICRCFARSPRQIDARPTRLDFRDCSFSSLCGDNLVVHVGREAQQSLARSDKVIMDDEVARAARAKKGSPFLSTEQAAFYLGLSARKLQAMRSGRTGPEFRRHSRHVRYHIDDLDRWSRSSAGDGFHS